MTTVAIFENSGNNLATKTPTDSAGMATETIGSRINALPTGTFKTLFKVKPLGSLQARRQNTGTVALYWRYSIGTASERVSLGLYDPYAPPRSLTPTERGFSIAAATRAAEALAIEHHQHRENGGRPAVVAAQRAALNAMTEAKRQANESTLRNLLIAYCDHLESLGRSSHRDARSIFNLHVFEAWPEIAAIPAGQVNSEHFADMMRKVIDAGKGRTANKLRSYARAAYQTAKAARSKANIPASFKSFGVTVNPVADTEPDELQNRPDKRPLSGTELRLYWQIIKKMTGFQGALLRFHLLTGGQRIEQLVNLKTANIFSDYVLIHDGKGRPGRPPRPHSLPLVNKAKLALGECSSTGEYALSTDSGLTHVAATTLSKWAVSAAGEAIDGFKAKRLRSGVETILAGAGVSKEVRGRLQSHGISGVQARHYDGHDYMLEKCKALETLYKLLEESDSKPLRSKTPSSKRTPLPKAAK